jgi:hypothetical protein
VKEPTPGIATSVAQEVNLVRPMTWAQFRAFINSHPTRRYLLDSARRPPAVQEIVGGS